MLKSVKIIFVPLCYGLMDLKKIGTNVEIDDRVSQRRKFIPQKLLADIQVKGKNCSKLC